MISLMIAMTVSCGVLLTSVSLLQIAREDFQHHHQVALIEDGAAFALEIISRTLRQAAQTGSLPSMDSPVETSYFKLSNGSVQGLDNARMSSDTASMGTPDVAVMNGNDVMAVNLQSEDGDAINCAGFVVSGAASQSSVSSWVFFHIVPGAGGEPDLHCRYRGQQKWDSQAILSGVEYFQVLYGVDTDGDHLPNQYLSASAIKEKDRGRPANDASFWRSVVAVHVALILRSPTGNNQPSVFKRFALFGDDYVNASATADSGTRIDPDDFPPSVRTRVRRHVEAIIFLHKPQRLP
jgi:type IV pilus assembly protein PilW